MTMTATLKLTVLALLRITISYCRRPPPIPRCIFPPDCDYLPVYVGTFDGRAR